MLLQLSHFHPFTQLHPAHLLPPTFPLSSSCPWVILISSLASTFPTLCLPSPCLFSTYHLCYLFSVPFPPLSPSQSSIDNPPCELDFCGSMETFLKVDFRCTLSYALKMTSIFDSHLAKQSFQVLSLFVIVSSFGESLVCPAKYWLPGYVRLDSCDSYI